ncbi:MAG TPA: response regulator, partial [Candidatus Polarisedimenticolia bacterium]|nr:response regulator [Candidatus Polarisedimenticolia bacterium]
MNPPDVPTGRTQPAAAGPGGATILVVDDKDENRALVQYLFDGPEYRVLEAADGVTGLARAQKERPDCILLDL